MEGNEKIKGGRQAGKEGGDRRCSLPGSEGCGEECDVCDEIYRILGAPECDHDHVPALVMHYLQEKKKLKDYKILMLRRPVSSD